jgi:outer membrane biosynthesis protein TonB
MQPIRKSLTASLVLHGAILAAALVVLPSPDAFKVKPQDAIQVDISMIGDVSKRQAQSKTAEKVEAKAAPKPVEEKKVEPAKKVAEEVKTAAKEPTPAPPPPPEPKKEEPKKAEPKPAPVPEPKKAEEPKPLDPDPLKDLLKKVEEPPKKEEPKKEPVKTAEAKPEKKPDKKPEKKKPKLNVDEISALLNKTDDEEKTAPQKKSEVTGSPTMGEQDVQGTDDGLVATVVDALVSRTKECWTVPPSARDANFSIKVHFSLNQDGTVAGAPEVVNSSADPVFNATAQSAVSAIAGCNYSDVLPPDKYEMWRDNTLSFQPNMMSGT